jgi:hypothetical protein
MPRLGSPAELLSWANCMNPIPRKWSGQATASAFIFRFFGVGRTPEWSVRHPWPCGWVVYQALTSGALGLTALPGSGPTPEPRQPNHCAVNITGATRIIHVFGPVYKGSSIIARGLSPPFLAEKNLVAKKVDSRGTGRPARRFIFVSHRLQYSRLLLALTSPALSRTIIV